MRIRHYLMAGLLVLVLAFSILQNVGTQGEISQLSKRVDGIWMQVNINQDPLYLSKVTSLIEMEKQEEIPPELMTPTGYKLYVNWMYNKSDNNVNR